ncbi:MAG TPA: hypothetical protein VGF55_32335, partial [Gemmataceae bacterium]
MRYYRRVLHYLKPYWRLAVGSVVLIVLGAGAGLLVPWPLKILFDYVLADRPLAGPVAWLLGPLHLSRTELLLFAVLGGVVVTLLQH